MLWLLPQTLSALACLQRVKWSVPRNVSMARASPGRVPRKPETSLGCTVMCFTAQKATCHCLTCIGLTSRSQLLQTWWMNHLGFGNNSKLPIFKSIHRILKLCPTTTAQTTPMSRFYLIPELELFSTERDLVYVTCNCLYMGMYVCMYVCVILVLFWCYFKLF